MRYRFAWAISSFVLLFAGSASAEADDEASRAAIERRLSQARAALERIARNESEVGAETEAAEINYREAQVAADEAEAALTQARATLESTREDEVRASSELAGLQEALGPRLRARYRMMRRGGGVAPLAADSPAAWLRLRRSFDDLLKADMVALERLRQATDTLAAVLRAAEEAEAAVAETSRVAAEALAEARATAEGRRHLLVSLRQERRMRQQVIRELSRARARLDAQIQELAPSAHAPPGQQVFATLKGQLPRPVEGGVVEVPFGKMINARFNTVTQQNGHDIRAHEGAEVRAVAAGKVAFSGWFRGYGNLVILDHGAGWHTLYAHLGALPKKVDQEVTAGELVGLVGDTGSLKGAYLYFEIRQQGKPVDPMPWFGP